jgi:hypothetical protein
MWLTIVLVVIGTGILVLAASAVLFSSFTLKKLRAIPKPPEIASESIKLFPAETRAGIKLHQACFQNDPQAANEALTMWAWASGDPAVANGLDRKMLALRNPELRKSIVDLWNHLESPQGQPWFGDLLWNAFVQTNPEFQNREQAG